MRDTKDYIIDEAFKLFLNHSYEAVTISEISKSIGLTKGALYHHYTSKEEIFSAVVQKYLKLEQWDSSVKYASFLHFIDGSLAHMEKILLKSLVDETNFLPVNYYSLLIDALRHYPGFEKQYEIQHKQQFDQLKSILQEAITRGEIRNDLDIDTTALNYLSINLGIAASLYTHKSAKVALEILQRQLQEFYKMISISP